jgi:hypothetical protein
MAMKCFAFDGVLLRREEGEVTVMAETVEEAKELLQQGEWEELASCSGETDFEWDRREPREIDT